MGTKGLQFPQQYTEKLLVSENNTIVWLGSGDFPAPVQKGFTVTKDKSVWDDAKTAWINTHPKVSRFAWDPVSDTTTDIRQGIRSAPVPQTTRTGGIWYNLQGLPVAGPQRPAGVYLEEQDGVLIKSVIY
jgi:hypothetical protein